MLQWKEKSAGEKAILIEGAMRIGKSTIAEKYSITSLERFMDKFISQIVIDAFEKYLNDLDTFLCCRAPHRQRISYSSKKFKQKG